jgi:hypothetical protein
MSNGCQLGGNAIAAGNFSGTRNAQPRSVRTNGTERLRVLPNGNVGIGTTNPQVKLHRTGNRVRLEFAGKRLDLRAEGGAVDIQSDPHNLFLHSAEPAGRNHAIINPSGNEGNVGIQTQAPSDKLHDIGNVRANDFLVTSDAQLKTDIRPIRGAIEKLRSCAASSSRGRRQATGRADPHRAGCRRHRTGADAWRRSWWSRGRSGRYEAVDLSVLMPPHRAFKELAAENAALTRRVEGLEPTVPSNA